MSSTRPRLSPLAAVALGVSVLTTAAALLLGAHRAWAAWEVVPETGVPGYLTLFSDPPPGQFPLLSPGEVIHWQIRVNLDNVNAAHGNTGNGNAQITMQFARDGQLVQRPDGLQVSIESCTVPWEITASPLCGGQRMTLVTPRPASDSTLGPFVQSGGPFAASSPVWDLGALPTGGDAYVLVTLSVPDTPGSRSNPDLMGLQASVAFAFSAFADEGTDVVAPVPQAPGGETPGDPPSTAPGQTAQGPTGVPFPLALTGADALVLVLFACGAVLAGLVLRQSRSSSTPQGGD